VCRTTPGHDPDGRARPPDRDPALLADEGTGRGVTREADEALDGTVEDMREFLKTGYRLARAEDDRVAVARILADPNISAALRAAAEDVIDGTPEELRYFLEVGRHEVGG
jgi:hypothetical protein